MTSFPRVGRLLPVLVLVLAGCSAPSGATVTPEAPTQPAISSGPSSAPTAPAVEPSVSTTEPPPNAAAPSASTATGWVLYDPTLDAATAVEAALAAAHDDGRNVLIEFGADWCPDCHVLAEYLDDPRSKAILDDGYHVVRVDVGYFDKNLETATRYGNAIAVGIPSVVILDGDGTKLVDTAAGQLADSRRYDANDIVEFLTSWQP